MNVTDLFGIGIGVSEALTPLQIALLIILAVWSLAWKGVALWKSAKKEHKVWFIVMLILNTAGILEILYIFVFSKMGQKPTISTRKKR